VPTPLPHQIQLLKNQIAQILAFTGPWEAKEDPYYGQMPSVVNKYGPNRYVRTGLTGTICYLNTPDNDAILNQQRREIFNVIGSIPATIQSLIMTIEQLQQRCDQLQGKK